MCTLAISTPLRLLSPFQLPFSFPPLKVLSPKIPSGGDAGQLFNTLQPHKDHASDIDGVVTMATTLLISLYSNLPTLYSFTLGWLPTT